MIEMIVLAGLILSADPPHRQPDGTLAVPPRKPKVEAMNAPFYGTVTAVGADSITIKSLGIRFIPPRNPPPISALQTPMPPPVTFRYPGRYPPAPNAGPAPLEYTYHISDVRVGDVVSINYSRVDGVYYCEQICINRRPGGRVPPAPGEKPPGSLPPFVQAPTMHHERMNAIQDWEERGIPIPDHLHPGGNQAGIAPPPREVQPKSPPAKE